MAGEAAAGAALKGPRQRDIARNARLLGWSSLAPRVPTPNYVVDAMLKLAGVKTASF
jgi:hypothetical protein